MKENVVFSTTLAENKNFTCNFLRTICIVKEFLLNQHIANIVFFFSSEAFYLYYIPRKRIQVFSLLCFVLLLYGPYASSGFQYNVAKLGGMGADYSAIFLDL